MRDVTVGGERLRRWLDGFADRHGGAQTTAGPDRVELTGADGARAWFEVPFPPCEGDVVDHVNRVRCVGVLLVRRSGYAVGVFDGAELRTSKVDSSYVQGTTKAGGWSQQRYARRRANQAAAAFAAAADTAARILLDAGELDAVLAGGDRQAVRAVLADRRLAHLHPTLPWLNVQDPKRRTLAAMPQQFRAVLIHLDP